jgi:[protein-PII] uridylyltransferase
MLDTAAAQAGACASLSGRIRAGRAESLATFLAGRATAPAANALLRGLAKQVDGWLSELWQQCQMPDTAALVAVGGYGRGELFPHSDVDILVLLPKNMGHDDAPSEARDQLRQQATEFVTQCFDCGLDAGPSVRTVGECVDEASRDITIQTSLLESRCITGNRKLFADFTRATAKALEPSTFLRAKLLEMRQRHQKFEETPYSLEPNCKESPGGLRDLQVVIWVARAAGLGRSWKELAARQLITPFEAEQLRKHEGTLKLIRARLHALAGRREDRIVFDLQTALAETFGYKGSAAQRASEVLMHRYYWTAKAVTQLNQILMLNIEERVTGSEQTPMREINARFRDRAGMLEVANDNLYAENPHAILETFLIYEQTPGIKGLSARTLRALYNAARPVQPRDVHGPPAPAQGHHPRLQADEPNLGAGALPVGVPAHRGSHAA